MKTVNRKFNVVIVGSGVTGLSVAYHLGLSGIDRILLISNNKNHALTDVSAGLITAGFVDNFSRLEHAFGSEVSQEIWSFGNRCYMDLTEFLPIPSKVPRFRLICTERELEESELAIAAMNKSNISSRLLHRNDRGVDWRQFGSKVLAVQVDDLEAGLLATPKEIIQKLKNSITSKQLVSSVLSIHGHSNGVDVICEDGYVAETEMLVLACHTGISELMPELKEVLIPYSDQWVNLNTTWSAKSSSCVYSLNYGHEWGGIGDGIVRLGGARFLRNLAGTGDKEPYTSEKATKYLVESFKESFSSVEEVNVESVTPLIGIRPCDELPVVGPMWHSNRIFISGGYMGSGLAMGFGSGKAISELILTGICPWLPYRLHPQRFRTLES